ncbi:amidotransferase 1, exosortase A system-associated [Aliidongia dinghuensis]|uniref:asparagine synthase (glutamine-hydrolyzing) n=1 Tax=Aliidongia dinghuensis TaxID=1867774 RepID=A0A8J2YRR0_9PROT|nr:XrtA/PEP-CTERM system amidotransferase [Aliidongia dinghuensis]GGF10708.1 amidotransferase 1, exosortase A system-associated [Aliidongia dinghuensis]
MCGIAGIYHERADRAVDPSLLERMNDAIAHRGPDGDGIHRAEGIGLAHRRLAIIDRAGGHQPLFNEDGSVCVTYNGEIYNFQELFEELRGRGHVFRTHCDTEAIVHAWEEWGEDCVTRFRGMFVFAIWDSRQQTLFLGRDRLGIKPLHYSILPDGTVVFGSELKSVLAHPEVDRSLDLQATEDYFALGYVPDPKTIYRHVHKLAPAHTLCIRRGRPHPAPRCYWDVRFAETSTLSEADAAVELVERLREAVRIRLVSEVPLGAFLSGGVDSSAVVALMSQESGRVMDTCSIAFDDPAYDESGYARQVATLYNTRHASETVSADEVDLVDRLAGMFDEPFADSSAMPTFRVSELARRRVTVALSGDGGDELFAGYRRYRWHGYEEQARRLVPAPLRQPLFGLLGRTYPKLDWAPKMLRAKSTFQAVARDTVEGYFHGVSVIPDELRRSLYSDRMRRDLGGYGAIEVFRAHQGNAPADDPVALAQYIDLKTWLPGDILTKVDRTSMAVALEVRVPILDHHFVEWAATLPRTFRLRGAAGKAILKKAFEPLLPNDILYRPKKGFSVPLASWFRGQLAERVRDTVCGSVMADSGLFDRATLKRLVEDHQSGRSDHAAVLWSLMMFDSFLRQDGQARGTGLGYAA